MVARLCHNNGLVPLVQGLVHGHGGIRLPLLKVDGLGQLVVAAERGHGRLHLKVVRAILPGKVVDLRFGHRRSSHRLLLTYITVQKGPSAS